MKKALSLLLAIWLMLSYVSIAVFGADNYNETNADFVTVRASVSSDGMPLLGNDREGTVLSGITVTVPYFDLDLYGLSDYYRRPANADGEYNSSKVIARPTILHLYIYLLERYYLGLEPVQCCKGTSGVMDYKTSTEVLNALGDTAYISGERYAILPIGTPGNLYLQNLWGHDENLMYLRNHTYPMKNAKYGATADFILLSDGDVIDLAMFTDWSIATNGTFMRFDKDNYTVSTEETLNFKTYAMKVGKTNVTDTETEVQMPVFVLDENRNVIASVTNGKYTFSTPGTYYLETKDPNAGTENATQAPAFAKVVVTAPKVFKLTSDVSNTVRVPLFKFYSSAKAKVSVQSKNVTYDKIVFTSDNKKVSVDDKGNVTNKGFFSRKATISAVAYSGGKEVAKDTITFLFYKFPWQLKSLQNNILIIF